jgi:hypothetical protein
MPGDAGLLEPKLVELERARVLGHRSDNLVVKAVSALRRDLDPDLDVRVHESCEVLDDLVRNLASVAAHP